MGSGSLWHWKNGRPKLPKYVQALQTGQPLRVLSDEIAEKTASQIEAYPSQDDRHLSEILAILDKEEPEFRT